MTLCAQKQYKSENPKMKNNYKQLLSTSPKDQHSTNAFKRSANNSFRSSFRLAPRKRNNAQTMACSSLPTQIVPRKAAMLLDISLPPTSSKPLRSDQNVPKLPQPLKVATIRRRSVWANSSASKIICISSSTLTPKHVI